MQLDRFKDFDPDVRELVLAFESRHEGTGSYFDAVQIEIIADYYFEVYDMEGAEAAVGYGEKMYPNSSEIRMLRANLLVVQGQYTKARKILRELEHLNPDDPDICYSLGTLYSVTDTARMAINYYLRAARSGYDKVTVYSNVADEYYKLGETKQAVRYYCMAIDLAPNDSGLLSALLRLWIEQTDAFDADSFFESYTSDHPFSAHGWTCLGAVRERLGQYDRSIEAYEYALTIDHKQYEASWGISRCYAKMGDIGTAATVLREALKYADLSSRPSILSHIAGLYINSGNYHAATIYLQSLLKEDPANSDAWHDMGFCSERLGYTDEAAAHYRRSIDLDPDEDYKWLSLADLYIRMERYPEACSLLESARLEAEDAFLFDNRLCYCYYQTGRRNKLFNLLQHDAELYPKQLPEILSWYPDMARDAEIVSLINSIGTMK